jgi:catechol 2,3-dioxygenase-like lactoylglutathione lyase family enzyme
MKARAFGFTKIVVADLDRVERFYRDVFGMEQVGRVTTDEHRYALDEVILALPGDPGGHRLVITRYRQRPCPPSGAAWTGFVVADMEATLAAVAAGGGEIEVPVHENSEHGVLAAIVADPEGHLIEIIQTLAASQENAPTVA